jgi:hypothetical protein
MRIGKMGTGIPSLSQLKDEYKKNRKIAKNIRKLPCIFGHMRMSSQYHGGESRN